MFELKLLRDLLVVEQHEQINLRPEIVDWSIQEFGHVKIEVRKFPIEPGSPLLKCPSFHKQSGRLLARDSYGIIFIRWGHDGTGYVQGEYDYTTAHMFFENERDLIFFKLRWFG